MDLFVFGTLLDPDVLGQYVPRALRQESAWLPGYSRACIVGEPYPALLRDPGSRVRGRLLRGLSAAEVRALDRYEGNQYVRGGARILLQNGVGHFAQVYLAKPFLAPRLRAPTWPVR